MDWWRDSNSGARGWRSFGGTLSLLPLKDRLESVAWLGNVRKIKLWLGFHRHHTGRSTAGSAVEVPAHLFGFIVFDGA